LTTVSRRTATRSLCNIIKRIGCHRWTVHQRQLTLVAK